MIWNLALILAAALFAAAAVLSLRNLTLAVALFTVGCVVALIGLIAELRQKERDK